MINTLKPKSSILINRNEECNLRKGKILIIDDSLENIRLLASILKEESYEILTANDPVKGLSIAQSKLPDIILLDVMMPKMDGYMVCEAIKSSRFTKDIPILFLTALNDSESTIKGFQLGAADYICKPFNKLELLARVKNHLNIKLSQEHTKALFESVYQTYITINKDMQIVNFNSIANEREELFMKRKFAIGDNIINYVNVEDQTSFKRKIENVFAGKVSTLEREYKIDEKSNWFKYYFEPIISNQGEIIGCLINGMDITEKKGFELRVQDYNHKLKEIHIDNKESLEYASCIQNAIFPSKNEFQSSFKEHFLIYKPKDIVSGDFYWMYPFGNKVLFVLGDCTGHGVPGALLTAISVLVLERIIKYNSITSPEEILYEIDSNLKDTLRQREDGIENGLEISICVFDKKNKVMEFAGAKRSLLITSEDDLVEIKGSRFDLGGSGNKIFKKHVIPFDDRMSFYLYSDGIIDQLGGNESKRFMKKNLFNLIEANKHESMNEQKTIYDHALKEWMSNEAQTDDITLIGLKIKTL